MVENNDVDPVENYNKMREKYQNSPPHLSMTGSENKELIIKSK